VAAEGILVMAGSPTSDTRARSTNHWREGSNKPQVAISHYRRTTSRGLVLEILRMSM
jgi:hypothetical protein